MSSTPNDTSQQQNSTVVDANATQQVANAMPPNPDSNPTPNQGPDQPTLKVVKPERPKPPPYVARYYPSDDDFSDIEIVEVTKKESNQNRPIPVQLI